MMRFISKLFGTIANKHFSFQKSINTAYIKLFNIDLQEFGDISSYNTLQELFTRQLVVKREIASNKFICPTDSFIMAQGDFCNNTALQIKGCSYSVSEFLSASELSSGKYVNFYLSPRDYHRYHSPCDMQVLGATHIAGCLYPVNKPALKLINALFAKNERVVLKCKNSEGIIFWLVFVGALNVGKMKFNFDANIHTNAKTIAKFAYNYENLHFKKGDELGYFELGSTVVLLAPDNFYNLQDLNSQKVKFGQGLSID